MRKIISTLMLLIIVASTLFSCTPKDTGNGTGKFPILSSKSYTYTEFSDTDKQIIRKHLDEIIPFTPTNEYNIVEIGEEKGLGTGIRYYTVGNTRDDFENYRDLYFPYILQHKYIDDEDRLWYRYRKSNITVNMSYYISDGKGIIDVIARYTFDDPKSTGVLSNKDKGLPKSENGVYEIDFSLMTHAKNAADQKTYANGCPSVGSPKVLVIPIEFSDESAARKGYTTQKIKNVFSGEKTENGYYSVEEYYYISSYGRLDIDFTVLDEWFKPKNPSTYYKNQLQSFNGEDFLIGDQMILDEALKYLEDKMDLSEFDSDNNGTIDAVIMVNTLRTDPESTINWAYRSWNIYWDKKDEPYEYDNVWAHDYLWIPYNFMNDNIISCGNKVSLPAGTPNPQTFIHEFGHIIGCDDYYDTSYRNEDGPMLGRDVMDLDLGDHNPYTKFNLGWIDSSRLVTTDTSVTLTLKPFTETGDSIIIANNWDDSLGFYQEYYVLIYYKNTSLNSSPAGYFKDEGLILYHVNAELYYEQYLNKTLYDLNNTNTTQGSNQGTANNLIEIEEKMRYSVLFQEGSSLNTVFDDNEELLRYTFTVLEITENEATITFRRK